MNRPYLQPIRVKRAPDSTWLAFVPEVGEWRPTPFFGAATFAEVERLLEDRNPGYRIVQDRS